LVILHYDSEKPPAEITNQGVRTICLPDNLKHWAKRTLWEATKLPQVVRQQKADLVLTVSGAITPNCPVALHRATREQFRTAWLAHAVMTH
jgi:hypothetical protein